MRNQRWDQWRESRCVGCSFVASKPGEAFLQCLPLRPRRGAAASATLLVNESRLDLGDSARGITLYLFGLEHHVELLAG